MNDACQCHSLEYRPDWSVASVTGTSTEDDALAFRGLPHSVPVAHRYRIDRRRRVALGAEASAMLGAL